LARESSVGKDGTHREKTSLAARVRPDFSGMSIPAFLTGGQRERAISVSQGADTGLNGFGTPDEDLLTSPTPPARRHAEGPSVGRTALVQRDFRALLKGFRECRGRRTGGRADGGPDRERG